MLICYILFVKIKYFFSSKVSLSHPKENQDAFFVNLKNKSVGLFDGLGGLVHGKEAATLAAEFCKIGISQNGIEKSLKSCHQFLKEKSKREYGKDIATTGTIIQIYSKASPALIVWGNVGDSRIYHYAKSKLLQKTVDDSLITQAKNSGWLDYQKAEKINQATDLQGLNNVEKNLFNGRQMVTQALGIGEMSPNIGKFKALIGDLIILTSDGVHDNLTNAQMEKILIQKPPNPAKKLVEESVVVSEGRTIRAKADDMTVLVVELSR